MSTNTNQKFVYRKHLRHPFKLLLGIIGFYLITILYTATMVTSKDSFAIKGDFLKGYMSSISGFVVGAIVAFIFLYFALFRNFKNASVELDNNQLAYINGSKTVYLPYESITQLKFPSIKYTGGWVKIKYGKKSIRLTVVLENAGEFIKELKEKLDMINKSDTYKEKQLFNFYKTATYSDQSWERMYEKFPWFWKLTLVNMIITFIVSLFITTPSNKFIPALSGLILFLIVYIVVELILGIMIAKRSKRDGFNLESRNVALENKVYKIVCTLAVVAEAIVYTIILL